MAEAAAPHSNRPKDTSFRQQKMPTWEPMMTPMRVIVILVAIGIIFVPTGTTLIKNSNAIYEDSIVYDEEGSSCSISTQNEGKSCTLQFTLSRDVSGPLYVYYELTNFYQNHRRYVASLDYYQLLGDVRKESDVSSTCQGRVKNGTQLLNPCGLIANSFFNDVISLETTQTTPGYTMDETGISWKTDRDYKIQQVSGFKSRVVTNATQQWPGVSDYKVYTDPNTATMYQFHYPDDEKVQYLYESYPGIISPLEGVSNEHFIVWMRTAALSDFRKLYGKIEGDLKKGDVIAFNVLANFEVQSFDGTKAIVITELGDFGGKNPELGVSYIVLGSLSFFFAALFGFKQILSPRPLGDPTLLNWS